MAPQISRYSRRGQWLKLKPIANRIRSYWQPTYVRCWPVTPRKLNATAAFVAENIEALERANLFRLMTPRRWGGYGVPLATSLNVWAELAKGCASSSWVAMITGATLWVASLLSDRGQEEIFANPAGLRICGVVSPTARGRRVAGGLRVSGKMPFASGCWHSAWALLGFLVEDEAHKVVDQAIGFVPISELEIEDTWFVAGMCGTGSNTLVAKDVFIRIALLI